MSAGFNQPVDTQDVMSFLLAEYRRAMTERNEETKEEQLDVEAEVEKARDFVEFGKSYFRLNPISRLASHMDGDFSFVLVSGHTICFREGSSSFKPGDTIDEPSVQVTGRASARDAALRGTTNAAYNSPAQNLQLPQPHRRMG